jgi:hypothetical protein
MERKRLASAILVFGLLILAYTFAPGYGPQETVFAETYLNLDDPNQSIVSVTVDGKPRHLEWSADDQKTIVDLSGLRPGWYQMVRTRKTSDPTVTDTDTEQLQALDKRLGLLSALGALLAVLAAPEVLIGSTRLRAKQKNKLVPVTGWTYLLTEPTGLSLARLQLVILFVPAAVIYVALAVPLHQFPPMPDSIWQMLGIGGATAALSTLITPNSQVTAETSLPLPDSLPTPAAPPAPASAAATAPEPSQASATALAASIIQAAEEQAATVDLSTPEAKTTFFDGLQQTVATALASAQPQAGPAYTVIRTPSLVDLFEETGGYGDLSRYQSLVMCVVTAAVFFVSFFDTWTVPAIPDQVLQLLGTSLAVYLGVKGIRLVKKSPAQGE